MKNRNLIEPEENLFQKSLHQEADFYKGIEKYHYKNIWGFSFAVLIALIILFNGLLGICLLITGAARAIEQKATSFVPGAIFLLLIVTLINFVAFRLLRKLIYTFIAKNREFKIKAILLLIVPISLFILIFILILRVITSMHMTF